LSLFGLIVSVVTLKSGMSSLYALNVEKILSKCVRCAREFSVVTKPERDMCFLCREESKDQATEDREFAWYMSQRKKVEEL
jgi:hypothetical protein